MKKVYFYRAELPDGEVVSGSFEHNNPRNVLPDLRKNLKNRHGGRCYVLSLSLLGEVNE